MLTFSFSKGLWITVSIQAEIEGLQGPGVVESVLIGWEVLSVFRSLPNSMILWLLIDHFNLILIHFLKSSKEDFIQGGLLQ